VSTLDDQRTLVHHRAALGDTILLWPLLRALAAQRRSARAVALVSDVSKARLASRFLDIEAIDAESRMTRDLWWEQTPPAGPCFARVIWFGPPSEPAARDRFERNLRAAFGASDVRLVDEQPDRTTAARLIAELGLEPVQVVPRRNDAGPVVLHVGAGSEAKRWPMERWCELNRALSSAGLSVEVIGGEVERERLTRADRRAMSEVGGVFLESLDELADRLVGARLVVCADSGPGHLAAQLGVRELGIFGPTAPERWAPVGPQVRVLAPAASMPVTWLEPDAVASVALEWLAGRQARA
jgi:ADP-heptose:LPS heptosyltransferase